ncbi:small GTP-binding protein [Tritrichomonas foetus]|uniref:Small GTP-binding protein n=1 Tax=Tritrichomonas foetus TaxID=1144522 RepID=A0A1J4JDE6_9EUKA|nr:small GTP-binding protein [Tritrichomonas foetus]|eukprot:OHS97178.1 small GTP-binding protein [Tritrichomonas foetus]
MIYEFASLKSSKFSILMDNNDPSGGEIERFKIVLIGDAGVGKTSLARRQAENTFEFKMNPTIGSSHIKTRMTVCGHLVELMLWDTAGHEQFASLVPLYSRNTDVCVVVASVVNSDSCAHIKTWIKRLNDAGEFPPIVVALNKIDLLDEEPINVAEIREKYAPDIEDIFLTSARTGIGVDDLFQQVAANARKLQKREELTGPQLNENTSNENSGGGCC